MLNIHEICMHVILTCFAAPFFLDKDTRRYKQKGSKNPSTRQGIPNQRYLKNQNIAFALQIFGFHRFSVLIILMARLTCKKSYHVINF